MSYAEEDELDWGEEDYRHPPLEEGDADAVDVVSLGDEDEIQVLDCPVVNVVQPPAPAATPQASREPPSSPNKNRIGSGSQSSLGLSHLPPKPRTVVPGGRTRETIKAAAMSRPHARSRSPPGVSQNELPNNWEIRRSELTVYYYHTVLCSSQLKRPTREDARVDAKSSWEGEAPPPVTLFRSLSARNAPSSRASWPERSPPPHQKSLNRALTPPRVASPTPRSTDAPDVTPHRARSNSTQQQQPPRAMSPSSMLLPRRGQSPARGLVRNGNDATNDEPSGRTGTDYSDGGPIDIEEHPRDDGRNRHADRTAGAPLLRRDRYSPVPQDVERPSRSAGFPQVLGDSISQRQPRQQEVPHAVRGGMDHYSPPPEDEDESHRHISRRRSVSPPRRTGMRSDDILSNQYASRRSVSPPRSHGESRTFERPLLDRMHSESRMRAGSVRGRVASDALKERDSSRRFDERSQRREGQEFVDPRGDELRELDVRTSRHDRHVHVGMSPQDRTSPMHGRNGDMFPGVDIEDPAYHEVPTGIHTSRSERFHGRPDIQRTHSSRAGIAHLSRSDVRVDSPRLSPHAIRNDVPLPQRHEYPPRDRMMNRGRSQNGAFGEADALGLGDRDLQSLHRDGLLQDTESPIIAEDRELHSAGPRGDGRSRHIQGQHRQTGSHGGYVANQEFNSPGFPEHHSSGPRVFSGRDRDFPREQEFQAEEPPFQGGERDFGPREDDRFQPNERRNRGFELHGGPRDQRLAEPIIHEHGLSPHARERLLSHEDQISPQSRAFIPPSSQRRDPPPHARIVHTREREQDSHIQDRTSKTWERGVEVPTPPPEQVRIDGRGRESGSRKERREGGADMEYSGTRGDRRRTEGENVSTYESEHKSATNRYGNWATRNADSDPSPRGGPVPLRMDMDVDPEPSPSSRNEPLPGWAGFRHRDRAADMEKSARTYRGRREGWPVVEGEQDPPNVDSEDDGRKRRRIDNGSNMSTKFGRDEQELPRKIPQNSNPQLQAPHSPVNSVLPTPNAALSISPTTSLAGPVDIEAARARARDVATQLGRVGPSSTRPKSRFGAPLPAVILSTITAANEGAPGGPSANPKASLPHAATTSATLDVNTPAIIARPAPAQKEVAAAAADQSHEAKGTRHPSQGSEDSSTPLVTRMVDASLGDTERTENPQRSGVRPHTQDGGWNSGSHGRDRGRQEGNRNGLDNNGSRYGRRGDFWRPDNDGYRDSPMRAWGKQDTGIQKEGPPSVAFVPNSDRSFVPRHAQGSNFVPREVRNRPPEGLPPKPPSPSQFRPPPLNTSGVYNQSSSSARARSPPRNRAQMFDADMADVAADTQLDISRRGPGAIAFFAASSPTGTPRKSSLLNRMTEPGGGDRSLMARLSGDQGGGDSQARGQRRPKISKPGPRR